LNLVDIAKLVATVAEEKKAQDVTVLDIRDVSAFADYFVICHGGSRTQVEAIATAIKKKCEEQEIRIKGVQGLNEARWVLIDIGDVVVHVFHRDERDFYDLERLWRDAEPVRITG
jgi:ribosome-associated protein